jgi:hypothetical protein
MPQLIGVLPNSDIENKSLTALLPQLTEALHRKSEAFSVCRSESANGNAFIYWKGEKL